MATEAHNLKILLLATGLLVGFWTRSAAADAAPDGWRSGPYYAVHGASSALLLTGRLVARVLSMGGPAGADPRWFLGDVGLRSKCSRRAAELSDVGLSLAMATPAAAEVGRGVGARFVNAELVYSQTLLANLFFNTVTKLAFRRPRPYTYAKTDDCGFRVDASDANVSFYSGHSSAAFAAATAGSYLFAEGSNDRESRWVIWGTEFALAAGVANLRVRAGKHYYSDVITGAIIGMGFGIAGPLLHGADRRPAASEIVAASYGLVFGVLASQLIPLNLSLPLTSAKRQWLVLPLTVPGSVGAQAIATL